MPTMKRSTTLMKLTIELVEIEEVPDVSEEPMGAEDLRMSRSMAAAALPTKAY